MGQSEEQRRVERANAAARAARDQGWANARGLLRATATLEGKLDAHREAGSGYQLDGDELALVIAVLSTFTAEVHLRISGVVEG